MEINTSVMAMLEKITAILIATRQKKERRRRETQIKVNGILRSGTRENVPGGRLSHRITSRYSPQVEVHGEQEFYLCQQF